MESLGHGTFGTVYKVQEISTGQLYAMKRISIGTGSSQASSEETVKNEMEIMKKLRHHHITTLAFSTKDSQYFNLYILPVAEGDLGNYLEAPSNHNYSPKQIYKWFGCLIGALNYAHRNNIKHKDVKPSNILLNKNGDEILITDFGLARDYSESGVSQTTGPRVVGTPKYLAPESTRSGERTEAVDVFALGCVFIELLYALKGRTSHEFDEERRTRGGVPFRTCLRQIKELLYGWAEEDTSSPTRQIITVTRNMLKHRYRDRPDAEFIRSQLNHDDLRCTKCPR